LHWRVYEKAGRDALSDAKKVLRGRLEILEANCAWPGDKGRVYYLRLPPDALSAGAALTPALKKGGEGENSSASLERKCNTAGQRLLDERPM
jgi:hypothetical protein